MKSTDQLFPSGLVLSPHEVRVPPANMSMEVVWVPGATERDGQLQHWLRVMQDREHEARQLGLVQALPVKVQRCLHDGRSALKKLFSGHGHPAAFQLDAPVAAGKTVKVDVLHARAEPGVLLWSQQAGAELQTPEVRAVLPAEAERVALSEAVLLVRGEPKVLLRDWPTLVQSSSTSVHNQAPLSAGLSSADPAPTTLPERALQDRIDAIATAFAGFGLQLAPMLNELAAGSAYEKNLARTMRLPFQMAEANRQHPLRNALVAQRIAAGMGVPLEALLLSMRHPHHVSFGELERQTPFLAAFVPLRRQMLLPQGVHPTDAMNLLAQYHEYVHVFQHAQHRQVMGIDRYVDFFSGTSSENRVFVADEVQAYGAEVEVMNLMLGGHMRAAARAGGTIDHQAVRRQLGIDDRFATPVQFLCYLAQVYFRDNREDGTYPSSFMEIVHQCIVHDGQTPYRLEPDGQTRRLN